MTTQTFEVSVGLDTHQIDVAQDTSSGKTTIRLDGKMAARPLAPGESSRELKVGPERYELRRAADGSFDLEFIGVDEAEGPVVSPTPNVRPRAAAAVPKKSFSVPILPIIGVLLLLAVLRYVVPWAKDALGVGWYQHSGADRSITFQMPVPPESERYNVSGIPVTEYRSIARENEFYVGIAQLPRIIPGQDNVLINKMRDSLLKRHKAKLQADRSIPGGAEVLARSDEKIDFKFRIIMNGDRIYLVGAAAPEGKLGTVAIQRFFTTFKYEVRRF